MQKPVRVVVWNEFRHEQSNPKVAEVYPEGIHEAIAEALRQDPSLSVRTAWLDQPSHGLPDEVLDETDVLLWWGHMAHSAVPDELALAVQKRVLEGMGLIALHSAHLSKIFKLLMGTTCSLKWRDANDKERVWNLAPHHAITQGIGEYFELPTEEMYGEPFGIPEPDELLFVSWFTGGEVFRSGACWTRGNGRVFYFRPGHETHPTYHDPSVLRVILNAVHWVTPLVNIPDDCPNSPPLEPLPPDPQAGERSTTGHR